MFVCAFTVDNSYKIPAVSKIMVTRQFALLFSTWLHLKARIFTPGMFSVIAAATTAITACVFLSELDCLLKLAK